MGRIKKAPATARAIGMFSTRDTDAKGVCYVSLKDVRSLLTLSPGKEYSSSSIPNAIIRIAPNEGDSNDTIDTLKAVLETLGAARVIVLPRRAMKLLPEQKIVAVRARGIREVVQSLIAESAFEDKEVLSESCEEILSSEGL